MRPAVPPHEPRHQSTQKRYRLGPWLVAVLTIVVMGCAAAVIVALGTRAVHSVGQLAPSPTPYPCPNGGPPPCLH